MFDVAAFGALVVLLLVVARGVDARVELAVAIAAASVVLASGAISLAGAADVLDRLGPTLGFLAAIFVVSEVARRAGLFEAAGRLVERRPRSGREAVVVVALLAAGITAALSLDATVVLFTPVVVSAVAGRREARGPALLATVEMANASSLPLPVSNLTNLLVFPATGLSFAGFGVRMVIPTVLAVCVVSCVAARAVGREACDEGHANGPVIADDAPRAPVDHPPLGRFGVGVATGIALMLVGFLVSSLADVDPVWVAAAAAVVLGAAAIATGRFSVAAPVLAASPGFLAFVAALAIVVGAAQRRGLDDAVRSVVPGGSGLPALLAVATVAAVLANVVNNLPATLVFLTVIPSGAVARLLALLIGVNVGPNLTYTGSLATLLWRREVRRAGVEPPSRAFYRMAVRTTPVVLVTATVALWAWLHLLG